MIPNFLDLPVEEADARRGELRVETAMLKALNIVSRTHCRQAETTESAGQEVDTCMTEMVEHVGRPEHGLDVLHDDPEVDRIAGTQVVEHVELAAHVEEPQPVEPPEPTVAEQPEKFDETGETIDTDEVELRAAIAEIEPDEDTWERDRDVWHRTKDRLNDEPDDFVAGIRRLVPGRGDAIAGFVEKRNRAKIKDKALDKAVGHALGVRKRKATWAVKSPVELRNDHKRQQAKERMRQMRKRKRAANLGEAGDDA